MKDISKDNQAIHYISTIIHLIENRETLEVKIKLEGLLRLHIETCQVDLSICPCGAMVPKKH